MFVGRLIQFNNKNEVLTMKARDMRGQLFKEKLQRLQLEGEIRALQFSIKYKELSKKREDNEVKFNTVRAKEVLANDSH
ncbi:hypothetical protein COL95_09870 [Bacillus anthracis]|nr:hypothetical protein COL95_09870 [Bacillus anthracis]